jgi:hypothetical protein
MADRDNKLVKWKANEGIPQALKNIEKDRLNLAAHFRKHSVSAVWIAVFKALCDMRANSAITQSTARRV